MLLRMRSYLVLILTLVTLLLLSSLTHAVTATYTYDELNRLTRVDYGDGNAIEYDYDSAGNRTEVRSGLLTPPDTTPPVTTASPPGGVYNAYQSVTLTCNDGTGSGCDRIYYTTDGTTPTVSSSVYVSPISVSAPMTLKFFAQDLSMNAETAKTGTYTFDYTLPTGTVVIESGATYTNAADVTLSLSCTDLSGCSQMKFSNDGTTYSAPEVYVATKVWALTTGDGTKTVSVRYMDIAGNWSDTATDSIILNTTCVSPFIRIGTTSYPTIQAAYDAAGNGAIIQARAVQFIESLHVNRSIAVTLAGGYDCGYTAPNGNMTAMKGSLTTTGGTVTINNFTVDQ